MLEHEFALCMRIASTGGTERWLEMGVNKDTHGLIPACALRRANAAEASGGLCAVGKSDALPRRCWGSKRVNGTYDRMMPAS